MSLDMTEHDLTCRELIEFLADYVDGTLSAGQVAAFDQHLKLCRDCRAYLGSYRTTIKLSRSALGESQRREGMPPALIEAIKAARRAQG